MRGFAGEFPLHIDLESTSACNLQCTFCWAQKIRDHEGFIEIDIAKKVFDEGSNRGLRAIKFNLRGEPLLHPRISDLVRYAKDRGVVDAFFNTNALLLDESKILKLLEAGLDRLIVSAEGFEKKFYERFRIGSNFDTVVSNVKNVQLLKHRFGIDKPRVRVQTVALPEILSNLDQYRTFWTPIADEVVCIDLQEVDNKEEIGKDAWGCPFIFQRMTVLWDGTILPCDRDMNLRHPLGNVLTDSIHEVWTGSFMTEMRQKHIAGRAHEIDICLSCPFRISEIKKQRSIKGNIVK